MPHLTPEANMAEAARLLNQAEAKVNDHTHPDVLVAMAHAYIDAARYHQLARIADAQEAIAEAADTEQFRKAGADA